VEFLDLFVAQFRRRHGEDDGPLVSGGAQFLEPDSAPVARDGAFAQTDIGLDGVNWIGANHRR
jgi:hypothetical protein